MSEHRILLRRAWELLAGDRRRIDLPADPIVLANLSAFRLIRRFHVPRIDLERESLSLWLDDLPGLVSARLDGEPLVANPGTSTPLGTQLQPGARAVLELEIVLRGQDLEKLEGRPFGNIALVIDSQSP